MFFFSSPESTSVECLAERDHGLLPESAYMHDSFVLLLLVYLHFTSIFFHLFSWVPFLQARTPDSFST